ncbi:MAG: hypothetical protein WCG86_05675 [Actinomycetota bacterium]
MIANLVRLVVAFLVFGGIAVAGLRWRKIRNDDIRAISRNNVSRSSPPVAPYEVSTGIRLLGANERVTTEHTAPARPRLDPDRDYVFSENTISDIEALEPARARHNAQWALERSSRRGHLEPGNGRVLALVALTLIVLIVIGAMLQHDSAHVKSATTTSARTPTTVGWPAALTMRNAAGSTATYDLVRRHYAVTVTTSAGSTWTVITMGPLHTLEYQGAVTAGHPYTLNLTGESTVQLGSPGNAAVSIQSHPVVFPVPLTTPLTLRFMPTPSAS